MNDILFGNNNKAIIKKLSKRNFRKNKVRNIAAILAIVMTAFLFTSITALAFGMQSSLLLTQQMQKGSKADGDIRYMTEAQFRELIHSDFVEQAGCRQFIGFATNTADHMIEIDYADAVQQELTFCAPTHGTAPQTVNEIATTDLALKALGAEVEIGATVPIEFELRGQNYHFDMVVSGWWEAPNNNSSLLIVSENFMEENKELFINTYSVDREAVGTYFSDVVLKDSTNAQEQLKEFARSVGGNPDNMTADNFILCAENDIATGAVQPAIIIAAICFVLLFMVCGYLLIYNIFDISVMQDVQQYGLLRTIGTSTRQIKRIVNRQAVLLTLIGLPLGLLFGFLISYILLPVMMDFFSYNTRTATQVSTSPLIFVIAAIFTVFTVFISTRKPVKKASKVSPVEAIRYTEQDDYKKKEAKRRKGAKLTHMAFSNLGRNKRRSAFIMVSMLLCIVLFNSVVVITQSIDEEKWISRTTKTDFSIYNSACVNPAVKFLHHSDALNSSAVELVKQQTEVINERYLYRNTLDDNHVTVDYGFEELNILETWNENGRTFFAYDNGTNLAVATDEENRLFGNVFGASDNFFDDLTIYEGETDIDILKQKLATGDYVVLGVAIDRLTGGPKFLPFDKQLQISDSISFYKNGELYKTCTILSIATVVSSETETTAGNLAASEIGGDAPFLYLSSDVFAELYGEPTLLSYGFDVESEKAQMNTFLDDFAENSTAVSYTSTALMEQQLQSVRNIVLMVGGMIGIIFALAGIVNFTNMMITNIITRRHEFATMQSIGMTQKQLQRMMIWEGLYYALGAGVFGCITATLIGLTILQGALNSTTMWFFTLNFTISPALIVSVLYLVMSIFVPVIALNLFNKGSVVERLRTTE